MASKGRIHDVFNDNLQELAKQSDQIGDALKGTGQRPWQRPEKAPDPLDVPGMTAAFDRSEIDSNYEEVVGDGKEPGTVGDVVSLKTQGDYIAAMERGLRARSCSPIRCIAFSAGRRKAHGHARGVLLGGVLKYAQDALTAGQG